MWFYTLIFFLSFFLVGFFLGTICIIKEKFVKKNWYLIIPIVCIAFWAIYYQIKFGFLGQGNRGDFDTFYLAGKQVLNDPSKLYKMKGVAPYVYLPSFAISFSLTISLFPLHAAYLIFYSINFLSGVMSIFEYNKILKLLDVKKRVHRFMFLIIISNGSLIYFQFKFCQFKFIIFIILLVIIRREMQYRKTQKEKDLKYYILNYIILIYAIGVAPYFIFLLLIYLFHDISFQELTKKINIQKFCIVSILFILENFLFVIYPSLIFEFLKSLSHPTIGRKLIRMLYIKDVVKVTRNQMTIIIYTFNSILAIVTLFLILYKKLKIEEKFSYFILVFLFFGVYSFQFLLALVLFAFILLLFVPFLNQDVDGVEFIKSNKILLIGLISIAFMFLNTNDFIFYHFFPIFFEYDNYYFKFKMLILHVIMITCLVALNIQKYKSNKIQKEQQFRLKSTKEVI